MDRRDVATLWQKIANAPAPPLLRASGLLHDREYGQDRFAQPGFVGDRYRQGGLVIFGLNPGAGGDLRLCIEDHWLGGNLAVNAVLYRLRTYLAVLENSHKYLKYVDLCVTARP